MNDPKVQEMFKRCKHNKFSKFIIGQDYYQLPNRTVWANGNVYHILRPNKFRDVQENYQDKSSMDMALNEYKYQTRTCWNNNYQPLINDMTKDKHTGRYRLGLKSFFIPNGSLFKNNYMSICHYVT